MGVQRELEITVLSATNLHNVSLHGIGTMNPYAVLWIDSHSKAATHVAPRGGTNPTWNSIVRMLCRETLFGTVAKAKLVIEIFDYNEKHLEASTRVAGTAEVLLSELMSDIVRVGATSMSEPKRVVLPIRRFRKGSCQQEKVIGSVEIQVRFGVAVNGADEIAGAGVDGVVVYKGMPIQRHGAHGFEVERSRDGEVWGSFETKLPAPAEAVKDTGTVGPVYYQHAWVEKPKPVWKGIRDQPQNGRLGILAFGIGI